MDVGIVFVPLVPSWCIDLKAGAGGGRDDRFLFSPAPSSSNPESMTGNRHEHRLRVFHDTLTHDPENG